MEIFDGFPVKRGFCGKDWELDNCISAAAAHPETFEAPSPDEATLLQIGDFLGLHFLIIDSEITSDPTNPRAERMWVEVCDLPGNGIFRGHLTNTPAFISSLELGDVIEFSWEHVATIYIRTTDPRHSGTHA